MIGGRNMRKLAIALGALLILAGCAGKGVWAPDEDVARAAYAHDGPPRLTLFTMLNNRTGAGAHTSLMVNGSQRIIFDPAGSFKHETIPERNDVLYGATPQVVDVYTRYHARKTFHVKIQRLDVSPKVARQAMALMQNHGAVGQAMCSKSTSGILAELFPGRISPTWYPKTLAAQFGALPGVTDETLHEYDSDDNSKVLAEWNPEKAN